MSEFTVVISTYNSFEALVLQLYAVFTQGDDSDVVVADNGSTDGTPERLKDLFGARRGFRVIDASTRRVGGAYAKNMGVAAAIPAMWPFVTPTTWWLGIGSMQCAQPLPMQP